MIWVMLDWISVFVFGTVLTLSFLGVPRSLRSVAAALWLTAGCLAVQVVLAHFYGFDAVNKAYPLIVHLPLFLTCVFYFKKPPARALFALLTAYLLTIARNFFGQLLAMALPDSVYALDIAKFAVTVPLLLLLLHFWSPGAREFLRQRAQVLWIMVIPFALFYLLAYATTVYTSLLLESNVLVISFVMTLFAVVLCALSSVVGQQNERYLSLKQRQALLELQSSETEKRLEEIRYSQQKTRVMRHDLRHYLQIIDGYAAEGNDDAIRKYVREIQTGIDETVVKQYCLNEKVNLVVSSCVGKAKKHGVPISAAADVPETLEADRALDLCVLLANALENAAAAAAQTAEPWVKLRCGEVDGKLVVQVTNACTGQVTFENGIPKSRRAGHGLGAYSIATLAEKHGGTADFSCRAGVFTVRAVL